MKPIPGLSMLWWAWRWMRVQLERSIVCFRLGGCRIGSRVAVVQLCLEEVYLGICFDAFALFILEDFSVSPLLIVDFVFANIQHRVDDDFESLILAIHHSD